MPGTDSCAVMEGENEGDMEDEVVYTKPSLLGKLKAIASKVGVASASDPAAANVPRLKATFSSFIPGEEGKLRARAAELVTPESSGVELGRRQSEQEQRGTDQTLLRLSTEKPFNQLPPPLFYKLCSLEFQLCARAHITHAGPGSAERSGLKAWYDRCVAV